MVVVSGSAFHGFTLFLQVTWDYGFEAPFWRVYACVALSDHEQGVARRLSYRGFRLLQGVFGSAGVVGGVFQGRFDGFDGVQRSLDILAEKGWKVVGFEVIPVSFHGTSPYQTAWVLVER